VASLVLAGSAFGADQRVVKLQDDCEPASFNAALQDPNACVGDGRTTFAELLAQFFPPTGNFTVDRWQFSRPEFNIDAGGTITAVNEGGETHTFTRVEHFGNGCSPLDDGEPPAVDCAAFDPLTDPSVVPAGHAITVGDLQPGTVLFQCLIHPWMRSVVEVRGGRGGRG
jgi:plastocyanin